MFELFKEGRLNSCLAPNGPCTCKVSLLTATGCLALLAGIMQAVVGSNFSMAVLSEAPHAVADSSADFLGIGIEKKVANDPKQGPKWRDYGNKAIATLLVAGGLIIGTEAYHRWHSGDYPVWLLAVVLVTFVGLLIDLLRLHMFSKAREHSDNENLTGLILHATTDAQHKGIVATVALIALVGGLLGIEGGLYNFLVRLSDYLASLGLAGYMIFIITPRIWQGKSCCGHDHKIPTDAVVPHKHGEHCKHHHH